MTQKQADSTPEAEMAPQAEPAQAELVWLAVALPDWRLSSREDKYPDIGPDGVEMTVEQAQAAREDADMARLELKERP